MITKIIALVLMYSLATSLLVSVSSAHETNQRGIVRGRDCNFINSGWVMNENKHTNGNALAFRFGNNVAPIYQSVTRLGAILWRGAGYNLIEAPPAGTWNGAAGIISTYNDPSKSAVMSYYGFAVAPTYHVTGVWDIEINTASNSSTNPVIMAHEFGHAFGLSHVGVTSGTRYKDRVMYKDSSLTATTLHQSDILGASVITGRHGPGTSSPHRFDRVSANPNVVSNTSTHHHVSCSVCLGERVSNTIERHNWNVFKSVSATQHTVACACGVYNGSENHRWDSNNVCRDCGRRR